MTTPTLTPDELIRSRAFFDADEFAQIIEHVNETIPCNNDECDSAATWRFSIRCCGDFVLLCDSHSDASRAEGHRRIEAVRRGNRNAHCTACRHQFPKGSTYDDVIREGKL